MTQSTLMILHLLTDDLISYKNLFGIYLPYTRDFCASWKKLKFEMVLFSCKKIQICYENNRVDSVKCQVLSTTCRCVWFYGVGLGRLCLVFMHSLQRAMRIIHHGDRRGIPVMQVINKPHVKLKIAVISGRLRSKVREKNNASIERDMNRNGSGIFLFCQAEFGDNSLILCESECLLLFSL